MHLVPPLKNLLHLTLLASSFAAAAPVHLRTDHLTNPIGIDAPKPQFAWQSDATTPNWTQSAYELLVATSEKNLAPSKGDAKADIWDSGRITSSDSLNIPYNGPALKPQTRYFWQVRVWDNHNQPTTSAPAWFETGLLSPSNWTAKWIRRSDPAADQELAAVRWLWLPGADAQKVPADTTAEFRYTLHLDAAPTRASLHIVSPGAYIAAVNGVVTGEHKVWGAFDWEEIGPLLNPGDNQIIVKVVAQAKVSTPIAFAASLRITAPDGTQRRIPTDNTWQARSNTAIEWQPAQVVGPLTTPLTIGTDRHSEVPGPNRIATEAALLRKDFTLSTAIRSARLTITALGAYQAFLNGKPIAPHTLLNPGWTDFNKRVLYQTYDVTPLLSTGDNTIAAILGGGWHGSPMTWAGTRAYTEPDALRAQLDIILTDGTHKTIATDETWQTAPAPTLSSEIYAGEVYDARLETPGWNAPHFTAKDWMPAAPTAVPEQIKLTAQPNLSIAISNTLHPIAMNPVNGGSAVVYDMGQNMVGNIVLHVHDHRGTIIRMRFAERLNPDGSIYTENLRNATVTDTYILSGNGEETYTPAFTFHGFRYVELSGYPGIPTTASIEGLVYDSLPSTPSIRFQSSSDLLNKMGQLGIWGQRGNFLSIPTDCPQRDERLGWMGDAGVFWRTGTYNFDIASFTRKFLLDIDDAQTADNAFTNVSPNLLGPDPGAPGWADAGILVPYAAWLQYGDKTLLEASWPNMQRFMDFILTANPDYLRRNKLGNNYGDWLAPDQNTPKDLIATAYWAIIARDMKEMSLALGRKEDAEKYQTLYNNIAEAYRTQYIQPDGAVTGNTQSAYVVTLYSGIAPEALRANMTTRLVADIEAHNNHLTTGFLGTPFLMFVLDDNHRPDVAFKLLLQDTYPSWGYMVAKGATTWWERWNGDTGDPSMNSYNHYAFGSVMAWVFRRAAGIDTDSSGPGFHHLTIQPQFSPSLPTLHTDYDSPYGLVTTDWTSNNHRFTITTPPNTTATITLPNGKIENAGSGTHSYSIP
ncbi:MAG TPA: family 78 glycoside hydrolase catalytic domain [Edaphobacter sp.]